MRKDSLQNNHYYHILSKSIAGFVIFNNEQEFLRIINVLRFYQNKKPTIKFSQFNKLSLLEQNTFLTKYPLNMENKLVEIIAYCIMPTHLHLILQQLLDRGISTFVKNVLISYTRYFNLRHRRKGPLWESRFKNVLIKDEKQLLHLTRYVHLNPASAGLVDKPEDWFASSCREYLHKVESKKCLCNFAHLIDTKPISYRKFVNNRISYQKQLTRIKKLILEQAQPYSTYEVG